MQWKTQLIKKKQFCEQSSDVKHVFASVLSDMQTAI